MPSKPHQNCAKSTWWSQMCLLIDKNQRSKTSWSSPSNLFFFSSWNLGSGDPPIPGSLVVLRSANSALPVIAIAAAAAIGETDRRQRDLRKADTPKETGVPEPEIYNADPDPRILPLSLSCSLLRKVVLVLKAGLNSNGHGHKVYVCCVSVFCFCR